MAEARTRRRRRRHRAELCVRHRRRRHAEGRGHLPITHDGLAMIRRCANFLQVTHASKATLPPQLSLAGRAVASEHCGSRRRHACYEKLWRGTAAPTRRRLYGSEDRARSLLSVSQPQCRRARARMCLAPPARCTVKGSHGSSVAITYGR